MSSSNISSKHILKSISLFGGLQIFVIIANLLKVKAIAVFVGVDGVGQLTIFNNILNLVVQLAYLGLNFSAVRSLSLAFDQVNIEKLNKTYSIFMSLTFICAIFGLLLTILFSNYISILSFDTSNNSNQVVVLSLAVLFTILFNGNIAFLQGIRELKKMAKSSFWSSFVGLMITIPIFYYYREEGIVFSIVIAAFLSYLFSLFFSNTTNIKFTILKFKEGLAEGSEMIKLGIVMMVSSFIGAGVIYIINIFIVRFGSITDLGLFSAGNGITNQYIGLIFSAMAADYFPKLSSVSNDSLKLNELVNNQGEILLLIVCPILLIVLSFSPLLIAVLLSEKFISITTFIAVMSFAMLFKAASYPIGYISFAKGDRKIFFIFEGVLNSLLILLGHTLGYYFGGINGIAWGVLILYSTYFISVNVLVKKRYNFQLQRKYLEILIISAIFLALALINFIFMKDIFIRYLLSSVILFLAFLYSYKEIDKKISLTSFIRSKMKGVIN